MQPRNTAQWFALVLAAISLTWTAVWALLLVVPLLEGATARTLGLWLIPLVASIAAVLVRGKVVPVVVRALAAVVLFGWGVFLFAWMFILGGYVMAAAAVASLAGARGETSR